MSPEQRTRQELSPASDQYSWCAALFRALTGEMPGAEPKFPTAVPVWIRKVLTRGLAHEPSQRFPSMEALLLAFEQDPQQARRRLVNAVLAVAALVVVGVGVGVLLGRETPSQRAERECLATVDNTVQSTWNASRLATMREAFVTSLGEPGRDAFSRVWTQLEPETRAWADASRALCRMDVGSAERRSRESCLSARGAVLSSLAEVFASADAQVVENAQATVTLEVQPASSCNTVEAPVAALAKDTAADRELRPELSRARVLRAAGRYADGITAALEVAANAEEVKATRVQAEAQLLAGLLSAELRRPDTESLLQSAIGLAERAGSDEERARGWISLVGFYSERERFEDAHHAASVAKDISTRLGHPDLLEAERHNQLGMLSTREGDAEGAQKAFEQTLLLRRRHAPPSHPLVTRALTNHALSLPPAEGQPLLLEVLKVREQTLGPNHPETAVAEHNVGVVMLGNGSCQGARIHVGKALAIRQLMPQADPARLGREYVVLARAQECLGQLDSAVQGLEAGIVGPDFPDDVFTTSLIVSY
jgi:hypothetical protein